MKKIAIITFGCKVNQYESACIVNQFTKNGYKQVDFTNEADVYVINSCTVTNRTDYKSRNAIRKALLQKEKNPKVKIVVTGCYAQRNYDEIKKLGDIDFIIDNNKKGSVYDILKNNRSLCFQNILKATEFSELSTDNLPEKSRAFIKIQDGCDYYCTYCAIPYARGHSRSRKKENVINQIKMLTQNGYSEFVLGGINLGLYGKDLYQNYDLSDLLYDLEKIHEVKLIRLSSIEPNLFTEKLLDYFKNSQKIAHHFHIPLQSGNDEILKRMKRKYDTALFKNKIHKIKEIFPDAAFGFDVIIGFPGETEENFISTYEFLNSLPFAYLHLFIYSKRDDTPAAQMDDFVNGSISQKRSKMLKNLADKKLKNYKDFLITNKIKLSGIIEKSTDDYQTILSDHYVRLYLKSDLPQQTYTENLIPLKLHKDGIWVTSAE
jgi:threonylcarbamoyladenosine tRNA methylthiotransferase MtaB